MILIAGRMAGMIFASPVFGSRNYPVHYKIGLMFFLTMLIYPMVPIDISYQVDTFWGFGWFLANEIVIGITFGLILTIYFNFIYFAGDLIDRDLGFAMVNVVNPLDESQIAVTSNFFYVFSTLIFLHLNLHHELIMAMITSYERIKVGTALLLAPTYDVFIDVVAASMILGFQIAAPFVITVLIANIILALLSKAMPGMNIFILGMPFKIFFGFLLFIILMPYLYDIFGRILLDGFYYIQRFFSLFSP
jgi:flagellar biosynthetic protein FliR